MKKVLIIGLVAGAAWGLGRMARRAQQQEWHCGEEEASQEIDAGDTEVFVDPAKMFTGGR